ncbi:MAG: DUF47 family protein, partial [Mucilaginibacter polytrichastri]|nr:DUF47 family protein [Mucilaginibacter polytrichastri]
MSLNSIFQYFVPKDRTVFFPLFEKAGQNIVEMSDLIVKAVSTADKTEREQIFAQIDHFEHRGDDITHQIYLELSKNFITPFDREDIHALASAIDDIADFIHGSANRMSLYGLDETTDAIKKLAELIQQACYDLNKALIELKDLKHKRQIADSCIRINSVENQADDVFDRAVADLFLYEKDAIVLIKHKEILAALETATDRCE